MKLSLLPVSYFNQIIKGDMRIGDFAREAVTLGLDAIDISVLFIRSMNKIQVSDFRKEIEREGISTHGASTYPDFTNPDPEERKQQFAMLVQDMELLAEAGVKAVRVTAGQAHPEVGRKEGIDAAFTYICRSQETAKSLGMQVVFENHSKPGVWQYPDFDFPGDVFLELAGMFKETEVKIQFDTANPVAYGDDPMDLLPHVFESVEIIHAADTNVSGSLSPSVIGEGLVKFPEIFSYLKKRNYDGWISIEEASGTGSSGVRAAVANIRKFWKSA